MNDIERINALTTNARNTWFVLLAALVFVGITLMSIEHIDFYGVDRATTLPLVNVEVPTRAFFIAAPLLIAAIYIYFHLYLLRLWDALSTAPARIDKRPLGDVIAPWLITDAALHMRTNRREEYNPPTTHRLLETTAMSLNFAIAWAFGVIVIGLLWWLSMPARSFGLTLSSALSLFAMLFTGTTSFAMLRRRMTSSDIRNRGNVLRGIPGLAVFLVLSVPLVLISYIRTEGEFTRLTEVFPTLAPQEDRLAALDTHLFALDPTGRILTLAHLNLTGEQLIQRPQGWLPYAEAQKDYFATWCKREAAPCKHADLSETQERAFTDEWTIRRSAARVDLQKPYWNNVGAEKPDLRDAIMPGAFLSGSHLVGAQMQGADLSYSYMTGTDDRKDILGSTNLSASKNNGGALRLVDMTEIVFDARTDFRNAFMDGSVTMTDAFRSQLGDQCQSRLDTVLPDEEFYGRWLGWLAAETGYSFFIVSASFPEKWRNVDAIAPDPGCEWKPPLAEVQGGPDAPHAGQD